MRGRRKTSNAQRPTPNLQGGDDCSQVGDLSRLNVGRETLDVFPITTAL